MKISLWMLLILCSMSIAKANPTYYYGNDSGSCDIPVAAYQQPVVYQAPIVYHGAVFYYGPVYYMASLAAASYPVCEEPQLASTVIHITRTGTYSYSRNNNCIGSAVIHIPIQPNRAFHYSYPRRALRR